jgi:hypothetical protein
MPPMPPMPAMAPMPPRILLDDDMSFRIERSIDRALEAVRAPRIQGRVLEALEGLEEIHVAPSRVRVIPRNRIVTAPEPATPVAPAAPVFGARLASLRATLAPATMTPVATAPVREIVHF